MDTRVKPAYDEHGAFGPAFVPEGDSFCFLLLSKTLGVMLLPTNFLIGLGVAGALLLATRFASAWPQAAGCCGRIAGDMRLVAARKMDALSAEARFPPWDAAKGAPDGIVVLGGPIDADLSAARGVAVVSAAGDRIIASAVLAHRYPERAHRVFRRQRQSGVQR